MNKQEIIQLSSAEAKEYFLKSKSYCSLDLPQYFDFTVLLQRIDKKLSTCYINNEGMRNLDIHKTRKANPDSTGKDDKYLNPCHYSDVNYNIFANKDGLYDWRQLQIINPLVYVALVNEITEETNWEKITSRFNEFKVEGIECYSVPFVTGKNDVSSRGENIENWWTEVEQRSIKLSTRYEYMMNTDIVNCYGSIYTHTIAWAIHGMPKCKENQKKGKGDKENLLGDRIDSILRWSTYNQTCGIPQGSVLMDFIAELILGYADMELAQKIADYNQSFKTGCLCTGKGILDYKIIRYRDDYRIFTHTKEDASIIAKFLTEVLSILNFKLNQQKTFITDHIIRDAIKPDKYVRIQSKEYDGSMQKHLLLIHSFSERYPNSGSVKTMLQHFFERLHTDEFVSDDSDNEVLIALLLDIMYHNPSSYPVAVPIIGRIVKMKGMDWNGVSSTIRRKLQTLPYTEFLDIWMQRLTIKNKQCEKYEALICQRVAAEVSDCPIMHVDNKGIWNTEWMQKNFRNTIEGTSIIKMQTINEMPDIPTSDETDVFCNKY